MVSVSFQPVGNWFVVAAFAVVVTGLTLWAYQRRLQNSQGRWRWFALGLRLAAILLCLLAALRPSVVFQIKNQESSSLIFLTDESSSMGLKDEVGGQSRFEFARNSMKPVREATKQLGDKLVVKYRDFDSTLHDDPADKPTEPSGQSTSIGDILVECLKNEGNNRVVAIFLLSDGANNRGLSPVIAARQLRTAQVPVYTVAFGAESAGERSKDISIREFLAGPVGYVKNQLQVKGDLLVRGFAGQSIDVDLFVEGQNESVAHQRIKVPEGVEQIPVTSLKYVPSTPGEKRLTLRVTPKDGETLTTNNSVSTFVTIMKGGINVLLLQGPRSVWEHKYVMSSIASSPDIQGEERIIKLPARLAAGELKDEDFKEGKFDAYILSDLPADFMTPNQQALLARAVEKGAGLIMLGGRSSFGAGRWAGTPLARVLPVVMSDDDGQIEPKDGIKFVPNTKGLDSFLFQIAPTRADSLRIWEELPPLSGINHLGRPKDNAIVFGSSAGDRPEPVMVGADGVGRVLAFGGETWVWARLLNGDGAPAHRKFWRQVIFWLVHKEDKGENEVNLKLASRRVESGQKLDFDVEALDGKGAPIPGVTFEARIDSIEESNGKPVFSASADVFTKQDGSHGSFIATKAPTGDYRLTVKAMRDGKELGHDDARFIVFQDDREMEKPAADRALLRQIAEATGGESIPPEQISKYMLALKGKLLTDTYVAKETEVWDNWPFFLVFVTLLMMEWWVRKRIGWV